MVKLIEDNSTLHHVRFFKIATVPQAYIESGTFELYSTDPGRMKLGRSVQILSPIQEKIE